MNFLTLLFDYKKKYNTNSINYISILISIIFESFVNSSAHYYNNALFKLNKRIFVCNYFSNKISEYRKNEAFYKIIQ